MLRDVYWRQYPVDLLSDDKMACVEAMLPDELKYLPYMIYITALKICDDNGVFDLEDGVVFARLTRCNNVSTVFEVINLMRQRRILYRLFDNSQLCGLTDWTYSDKKVRTIEERRRLVAERIEKERARNVSEKDFTAPNTEQSAPAQSSQDFAAPEAETAAAPQNFSCPENDKNAKSVVKAEMDDKNAKNVVTLQDKTIQDNTEQTNIQDIQTNTHTQQQLTGSGPLDGPPPVNCPDNTDVAVTNKQNQKTENANTQTTDDATSAEQAELFAPDTSQVSQEEVEKNETGGLIAYLNEFFVKNCYGYKPKQSAKAIKTLAEEIMQLSDETNPPETIAGVLCSEFKRMCDGQRGEYWERMPLLPANMLKPRVLAELIQYAGKILSTANNQDRFIKAAQKARDECEQEKANVGDAVREEYLKYNINPDEPGAVAKLLAAKSREQKAEKSEKPQEEDGEKEECAETDAYDFEIF